MEQEVKKQKLLTKEKDDELEVMGKLLKEAEEGRPPTRKTSAIHEETNAKHKATNAKQKDTNTRQKDIELKQSETAEKQEKVQKKHAKVGE